MPSVHRPHSFFFNDTATTEIYTLSLHDALPISPDAAPAPRLQQRQFWQSGTTANRESGGSYPARERRDSPHSSPTTGNSRPRSEEHTSELQSHLNIVCRLLLEKKNSIRGSSLE